MPLPPPGTDIALELVMLPVYRLIGSLMLVRLLMVMNLKQHNALRPAVQKAVR
jgi:hypothetical protein